MKRLFLISMALALMPLAAAWADIIHVPGDYPTIQEGIDACSPGDTVMVAEGTYYENLIIQTGITLTGENRDNTIIDGSGTGDVVLLDAESVSIGNFTVRNGGPGLEDSGIELCIADYCSIENCVFENNYSGVYFCCSCFNVIARCRFGSNDQAILFFESFSGPIRDNLSNQIENNVFEDNFGCGILFEHTVDVHHNSTVVQGNRMSINDLGMSMIMSQSNEISYNSIESNSGLGISLEMCLGGGDSNVFHHNNFVSNHGGQVQASDIGGGVDYWYESTGEEGNYWSDYTGSDDDGDGIGDTPYYIEGGESQDLYPLMEPLQSTIQGGISDGLEPIEGVHVQAMGTEIDDYTDNDGIYSLESLCAGNYDISFSHPMYEDTVVQAAPTTLDHVTDLDVIMRIITDTDEGDAVPHVFALYQNYPNPFNASTTISYRLNSASDVTVEIYDVLGGRIETMVQGDQPPGDYSIVWDARDRPSGVYFYRIEAGEYSETRKMVLMK
jgi:nitrous oxidase accessory protein NosD